MVEVAQHEGTGDEVHGVWVPDPYRWLEVDDTAAAKEWMLAQARRVDEYFAAHHASREAWLTRLRDLTAGSVSLPRCAGGRIFIQRAEADAEHPVCIMYEPDGRERVLIDPTKMSARGTVTLDAWSPSPDGRLLGYETSDGGGDASRLWVLDVDAGQPVDGPIEVGYRAEVAWSPDASGFFYQRPISGRDYPYAVYRHELGADPDADPVVFTHKSPDVTFDLSASPDGRWLAVASVHGSEIRSDVHLIDVASGTEPVAVIAGVDCLTRARFGADNLLYLLTTLDAPHWRLVAVDPCEPVRTSWRDVVPPGEDVLTGYALADTGALAVHRRDVVSTIHRYESASRHESIELPGTGTADIATCPDRIWVHYVDFATPERLYMLGDDGRLHGVVHNAAGRVADGVEVEQLFARSSDGTRVPMFVLSPAQASGVPPTIVEGYGGWYVAFTPAYSPLRLAWVQAGGRWVVTNLRGGGEYGAEWFHAGMRQNQQNPVDDYLACIRLLMDKGYASPATLGGYGGSKGGLTVGAAMTQEPELFRAVVLVAPILDMVRYEQLGAGSRWIDGFGSVSDPEQFEWLRAISAYHRVRPGTAYPAVLLPVSRNDTRVNPAHARKMCAALQEATTTNAPVLLRVKPEAGHAARSTSRLRDLYADILTFFADQLALLSTTHRHSI